MKAQIHPTEKISVLKENLRPRVKKIEQKEGKITVEDQELEFLEKVPGINEYSLDGEERKGLGGSPVDEKAYININSKEDVAKAFLATASGYDLVVTNCSRDWDLKMLRRFNPSIKEVSKPDEIFGIEKAVNLESYEDIGIELDEEDVEPVYRKVVG